MQAAIARLGDAIAADPDLGTFIPQASPSGDLGVLLVPVPGAPSGRAAFSALERLRNDYIPAAFSGVPGVVVVVGGLSAGYLDFNGVVDTYMPISFGLILGVSFILLLIVFRSIVIPIKAIIMNLLSVGAAYGLMVLVFQKGVGADLLGFQQTETIDVWLPLVLFAVLFGLSMDYHVFMLSRIREEVRPNAEQHGVRGLRPPFDGSLDHGRGAHHGCGVQRVRLGRHGRQPAGWVRACRSRTPRRNPGARHTRSRKHAAVGQAELVPAVLAGLASRSPGRIARNMSLSCES